MKKLLLSTILATALFSAPAMAKVEPDIIRTPYGDFDAHGQLLSANETALKAMDFKAVEKQAKQGDNAAQFYLAKMYQLGIHTQKDGQKAMEWYKKSAENGNANAMNNVAAYLNGGSYYDLEDNAEVLAWFNKAIAQNHPIALYNLAHHYLYKKDNKDIQKGIELLLKAGEIGFAPAYDKLSEIYRIHPDFEQDTEKSLVYLQKSAEMGFAPAQMKLSNHYQINYMLNVDKSLRPLGVVNAYQWANRACVNGVVRACQITEDFLAIKKVDLSDEKNQCEMGNKDACESYEIRKSIQEEMNKLDK